ncbi:MAG: 23S rRNA (adenine(2503)-C(2))-methyltransferase RlmN [Candidatus Omnitrophica bacterium]|nr:23S rRNA (adenine(2503)-C(2))-methyltransferase RlmN [Candidatus Omnitrophota bacterium]
MNHQDIRNLSLDELCCFLKDSKEQSFRATQIFKWIYQKGVTSFDQMKNLSQGLREKLAKQFTLTGGNGLKSSPAKQISIDGTTKYLFELADGEKIETVLIPTKTRATVCVSTQAGCKFGCRFCASGVGGFKRNLTTSEILAQILTVQSQLPLTINHLSKITHIVFMGTGEPLDNYENVLKAVRIINLKQGLGIGARRITVSTCGVIPGIERFSREGLQVELAISLHGFDNASRNALMPVNRKYPFDKLMQACREYTKKTKRQITFEYILIKDLTSHAQAAQKLARSLKGVICKMNLIPYNPVQEFDYEAPSRKEINAFKESLIRRGVHVTLRSARGQDVSAACGQLRYQTLKGQHK